MQLSSVEIVPAVIGGGLIGLAASLFLLLSGRIAGNSGMLHGLLPPQEKQNSWRLFYLFGLALGAFGYVATTGDQSAVEAASASNPFGVLIGSVFVGVGTRLSGGCTSGHGVCGIGRLSPRSFAATVTSMIIGMLTVFIISRLLG